MKTAFKYKIQAGDSFDKIAKMINGLSGITYIDIEQANPSVSPSTIQVGQEINIPIISGQSDNPQPKVDAPYMGYWNWTWDPSDPIPGANLGMAFSGWGDPDQALDNSKSVVSSLVGTKYLTVGGGNENGRLTANRLTGLINLILNGSLSSYSGIALDVEEGDSGLASAISAVCNTAKNKGMKVLITVSHAAPYNIPDAKELMLSMFADSNIDFMSPQMYGAGGDGKLDTSTDPSLGIGWSDYKQCKAKIIPSIDIATLYDETKTFFASQGVSTEGYIQWSHVQK